MRKPNSNSVLKTLPPDRQADIAAHAQAHSLEDTVKWLAERRSPDRPGIISSSAALSEFLSWYSLSQQLARNASAVEMLLSDYVKDNPKLPPEKIQAMGQAFFSAMSLAQRDPEVWVQVQRLNLQREQLHLDREKFELLAAEKMLDKALRQKADEINASGLSQADKIAAMRKVAFKDVETLQASGKLKIPKA